jgi:hypothetical protein
VLQGGFQGLRDEAEVEDAEDGAERMHAALVDKAQKQLHLLRRLPVDTQRRRMVSWLQRRGHSWNTCQAVLHELGLDL